MPSRSEYIRLIVNRLGLPSEYNYCLIEYSPIIPQKSITTTGHPGQSGDFAQFVICTIFSFYSASLDFSLVFMYILSNLF